MLVCALCLLVAFSFSAFDGIMTVVVSELFVVLNASFGLFVNLKMPNLKWTDETVPVKQSLGVLLTLFGGWILIIALGALYFAVNSFIAARVYMIVCASLFAALSLALVLWIKKRGSRIFAAL